MAESPFAPSRCYLSGRDLQAASEDITPPSSLIQAHAPDQNPPVGFGCPYSRQVFAGCRQSLLGAGPSRRYLRRSVPGCLGSCPGGANGCSCLFLPRWPSAFPNPSRRVGFPRYPAKRLRSGGAFRDHRHFLRSGLLACLPPWSLLPLLHSPFRWCVQLSPTSPWTLFTRCPSAFWATAGQLWLSHPSRTHVVTFIGIG
jgi:hypothetical protein